MRASFPRTNALCLLAEARGPRPEARIALLRLRADAARGRAALITLAERRRALRRRPVRPLLRLHRLPGLALQRVVADLPRGVDRLVDVADLELAAAVGV